MTIRGGIPAQWKPEVIQHPGITFMDSGFRRNDNVAAFTL